MKGWNDTMKNENKTLATMNSAFMALKDFNLNDALRGAFRLVRQL